MLLGLTCLCCEKVFAIVVYNDNETKDCNFEVFLNGVSIGSVDNNKNDLTGRIFALQSDPIFDRELFAEATPNVFQPTVNLFVPPLLVGANVLKLTVTQTNGVIFGNTGVVLVAFFQLDANGLYQIETEVFRFSYVQLQAIVGEFELFPFTYQPPE